MASGRHVVHATAAAIGMGALLALGDTLEVQVEGHALVGAKMLHHAAPLAAVGFYTPGAVQLVHDVMRHLVRHRIAEILGIVLGEDPGVVTDPAAPSHQFEHAGRAPTEVKQHRHLAETAAVYRPGPLDIMPSGGNDLAPVRLSDWFQHGFSLVSPMGRPAASRDRHRCHCDQHSGRGAKAQIFPLGRELRYI